jgi:hypothetical protein
LVGESSLIEQIREKSGAIRELSASLLQIKGQIRDLKMNENDPTDPVFVELNEASINYSELAMPSLTRETIYEMSMSAEGILQDVYAAALNTILDEYQVEKDKKDAHDQRAAGVITALNNVNAKRAMLEGSSKLFDGGNQIALGAGFKFNDSNVLIGIEYPGFNRESIKTKLEDEFNSVPSVISAMRRAFRHVSDPDKIDRAREKQLAPVTVTTPL